MKNNLKELIAIRGLSVSEFARMTGIPQPTMHRIVSGQVHIEGITALNFLKIAHGLGLSAEELYYGDLSYDADKSTVDRVFARTCDDGRKAMLANALGVESAYPLYDATVLPTIRNDMSALKGI